MNNSFARTTRLISLSLLAGTLAVGAALPPHALAEGDPNSSPTQAYDSSTGMWQSDTGYTNGQIHITYDTTQGTWEDPGANPTNAEDNGSHQNGTYQVVIPTSITYTGLTVGEIHMTESYEVTVRGAIPSLQRVRVTAEGGTSESDAGGYRITEAVEQGKDTWGPTDCVGDFNADGSLTGTTSTDQLSISGVICSADTIETRVSYTSKLERADK